MSGFRFKQFAIRQDRCAMKVGTDGVLLGAWAMTGERMLDVGTGTGLIALMLAQRRPNALVDAVEIDEAAADEACENVAASPFSDRVSVLCGNVQKYEPADGKCYDAIVSNPPFFHNALGSPDGQRHTARHTDSLSYRELFDAVTRLLTENGTFSVVIPFDCRRALVDEALLHGFSVCRECAVRTTPHKMPRRYLLSFSRMGDGSEDNNLSDRYEEVVLMDGSGERSEWYQQITADFYL